MTDLNRLEQLAKAAIGAESHFTQERADAMFHSAANPKTILSLIQRIRELESMSKETK